jgi:hypothetical protein
MARLEVDRRVHPTTATPSRKRARKIVPPARIVRLAMLLAVLIHPK